MAGSSITSFYFFEEQNAYISSFSFKLTLPKPFFNIVLLSVSRDCIIPNNHANFHSEGKFYNLPPTCVSSPCNNFLLEKQYIF